MDYSRKYFELKKIFKSVGNTTQIDDVMDMKMLAFDSEIHWERIFMEPEERREDILSLGMPDSHFPGNNHFSYPVIIPRFKKKYDKVIVLLHGLNERFWYNYPDT